MKEANFRISLFYTNLTVAVLRRARGGLVHLHGKSHPPLPPSLPPYLLIFNPSSFPSPPRTSGKSTPRPC